ncbi:MAG: penicillin acylase family protein [Verrucomicrobiota bacterium]|nr:penicillin acylase family protein [Verrucomicrobiota bacterium]
MHRDAYGIPHVFAANRLDGARVIGWLHGSDRLWQMDLLRRQASGTMSEVFGRDRLKHDILMRRLGLRRTSAKWWESGRVPKQFRAELQAYADGVNARMVRFRKNGWPNIFNELGYQPEPWSPVDSIVFTKYMGWDQSGTDADLWFGIVVDKLGVRAAEELWPLDRPYEIPTVRQQYDRKTSPSTGSMHPLSEHGSAFAAAMKSFDGVEWLGRGAAFGSNNWAVDGTKTRSGKPILCSDPHLGFDLPSLWYAWHLSVDGWNIAGAGFPTAPYIVIGHNDHLGWGITNMQADVMDYFIEKPHPDNPRLYHHRGEWKEFRRVEETIPIKGEAAHLESIEYTVHGPIISSNEGLVAAQWTGLGETRDGLAIWMMNRASNLTEALAGFDQIVIPTLSMAYADVDGNIAIHACGAIPLRMRGQGRIPMDGASGEFDWRGFIPRHSLPLAVNPPESYVGSANGRPASIGYPHHLGWMWDSSYRTRRMHELLARCDDMTVEKMIPLQNDAHDKAAERFLPTLLGAVKKNKPQDPFKRELLAAVASWDYRAKGDSAGPLIWLRWFHHYRAGVWNDEWPARGLPERGGSWGYTSNNRRQPMLEVLEYITREHPNSEWFDDQATAGRETRDDIIVHAFHKAAAELQQRAGNRLDALAWEKVNKLHIGSISGNADWDRGSHSVPGDSFTLNPGSSGGRVGGGASWRMVVDFANPSRSIGVYPGGQSGNPDNPHYADLIPLWAQGKYAPLNMVGREEALKKRGEFRSTRFTP